MTHWVVLQVPADLSGVDDSSDVQRLELSRVSNAGKHHDLWSANGAGRQNDLLGGIHSIDGAYEWQNQRSKSTGME